MEQEERQPEYEVAMISKRERAVVLPRRRRRRRKRKKKDGADDRNRTDA